MPSKTIVKKPAVRKILLKKPAAKKAMKAVAPLKAMKVMGRPASRLPLKTSGAALKDAAAARADAEADEADDDTKSPPTTIIALPTLPAGKVPWAEAMLQHNVTRRAKRFTSHRAKAGALVGRHSLLEQIKVATRQDYVQRGAAFEAWRADNHLVAPTSVPALLGLVLERLDVMFMEGCHHGDGEKLIAAIAHLLPMVHDFPVWKVGIKNALSGWEKREPGGSHAPAPPPKNLVFAIVAAQVYLGFVFSAVGLLLQFFGYLRPGEMETMLIKQLVPPNALANETSWSVILGAIDSDNPAKNDEREESVLLDDPEMGWMHNVFQRLLAHRAPHELVLPLSPGDHLKNWKAAVEVLGLQDLDICRYSLRHAGASNDLLEHKRDVASVKARGRWKADSSMKRCMKTAKAMEFSHRIPDEILRYGQQTFKIFPAILNGSQSVPAPPRALTTACKPPSSGP